MAVQNVTPAYRRFLEKAGIRKEVTKPLVSPLGSFPACLAWPTNPSAEI